MTMINKGPTSLKEELRSQIQTADWNITNIDEGKIFEHRQTGKLVFVPQQNSVKLITKCLMFALKNVAKELRNEKYYG